MTFAAVLLHLALCGSPRHAAGEMPDWARPVAYGSVIEGLRPLAESDPATSACVGDSCQPRVAIPGWQPRFELRAANGFMVAVARQLDLGFVTSALQTVSAAGLRVEYRASTPGTFGADPRRRPHATVGVRWRLDAWNEPPWVALLAADGDGPGR